MSNAQGDVIMEEAACLNKLAEKAVALCNKKEWSLSWDNRAANLHLEASELIEAVRGKHSDVLSESGDVLFVLMTIIRNEGLLFSDVVNAMEKKIHKYMLDDALGIE